MVNFYNIFADNEGLKEEILTFLSEMVKSKPVNVANTALDALFKIYESKACSE